MSSQTPIPPSSPRKTPLFNRGVRVKGDVIPDAVVEPLLAELQELFARYGASAALSAKATIKPTKEFHAARHTLFSVAENHELDKIVPISASVKTKLGRGGSDDE